MVTVPSTPRINTIDLAAASAGPFEVGFRLFDGDAVEVYLDGDRVAAGFTISTSFSDGYDDDGTITFDVELDAGTEIKLLGKLAPARGADYGPSGVGLAGKLNLELGRIWTALVELRYGMDRALRGFNEAPVSKLEVGKAIFWDGSSFAIGPALEEIENAQTYAENAGESAEAAQEFAEAAAQFEPSAYLRKSENLSGLSDVEQAQANIGMGESGKAVAAAEDEQELLDALGSKVLLTNTSQDISGNKHLNGARLTSQYSAVAASSFISLDLSSAQRMKVVLDGDVTFNLPYGQQEGQAIALLLQQDGTGGRIASWASGWKFPGGEVPELTPDPYAIDLIVGEVSGPSEILVSAILDLK